MLIVVRRKQRKDGNWYFAPVDQESFSLLWDAIGYGWFDASQWQVVLSLLRYHFGNDAKMSNRWKDIVRLREPQLVGY